MSLPLLALLLNVFDAVQCTVIPSQPRETTFDNTAGDSVNGWTPKPTQKPLRRQVLGAMQKNALFGGALNVRGVNSFTCGWWQGIASSPIDCGPTAYCETFTDVATPYFGCCDQVSGSVAHTNCVYRGACLNYGDNGNAYTETGYTVVSSVLSCGVSTPACYTIENLDKQGTTWYYRGCGPTPTTEYAYMYIRSGSVSPASVSSGSSSSGSPNFNPPSTTSSASLSSSSEGAPLGPDGGQAHGSTSSTSSSSAPSPTHNGGGGGGGGGSSTGAIAGGVVGGVAGVALIGAAVGYLIHRKRKQRVQPVPEVSQYGY